MKKGTKIIIAVAGAFVAVNVAAAAVSHGRVYAAVSAKDLRPPPSTVSIVIPGWKEPPEYVVATLKSLKAQNIVRAYPDYFQFVYVGCEGISEEVVTPYVNKFLCARRGKLFAKTAGILASDGDIIVSVDSDAFYPPNWMNELLKPFRDPSVVGVTTTTSLGPLVESLGGALLKRFLYNIVMMGRGSAFTKAAYDKVGGFDLSVDQTKVENVWLEEEFVFRKKLERIGKVVDLDLPVQHLADYSPGWRGLRADYMKK